MPPEPAPPAVLRAPELPPWPDMLPDPITLPEGGALSIPGSHVLRLEPGTEVLPFALAEAVLEQLAAAEQLPALAQARLDEQARRGVAHADAIRTVWRAVVDTRVAEAIAQHAGDEWWVKWVWGGLGIVGGAVIGAVITFAALAPDLVALP